MQKELPSMIGDCYTCEKIIYQLNYSESCAGDLNHCDSIIEGYQHNYMSKDRAFESLLTQNYSSFILTIKCTGVSIYHTDNGSYKVFGFSCKRRIW